MASGRAKSVVDKTLGATTPVLIRRAGVESEESLAGWVALAALGMSEGTSKRLAARIRRIVYLLWVNSKRHDHNPKI
jgi:hypothetical protein